MNDALEKERGPLVRQRDLENLTASGQQPTPAVARVAAIVILYHPEEETLGRLLDSLVEQVEKVFIYDNTPEVSNERNAFIEAHGISSTYFSKGINYGIATAQNEGIRQALKEGYTHVLFLDQDSAPCPDMVSNLLKAEEFVLYNVGKLAAVGPLFVDEKSGELSFAIRYRWFGSKRIPIKPQDAAPIETDFLISSGSLIRISVINEIGYMRDELFIDWVDAEWCLRALKNGYKSYIVPNVVMAHNLGDTTIRFLGRDIYLRSPARNYYIVRNTAYLLRHSVMGWKWRSAALVKIPKHIVIHSWFSQNRLKSCKEMISAALDGLMGTMKPFSRQ